MYAVIDLGSNTIRLSTYDFLENETIKQIFSKKYFVGLAGYVDKNGILSEKGLDKAIEVLLEFQNIIECVKIDKVYVIATASLRNIINTEEAVKYISEKSGFDIVVLSGVEEATYDYIGANREIELRDGLLIDIGGGSTELVLFKDGAIEKATSFPVGALNMFTKFVSGSFPTNKESKMIKKHVKSFLEKFVIDDSEKLYFCGIGGSIRSTGNLNNDLYGFPMNNKEVKLKNVRKMITYFGAATKESILKLVQVVPERTHTIIPGMIILNTIAKHYNCKQVFISDFGVREGYLLSKLHGSEEFNAKTKI